jgi:hypothetical protein
MIIVEDGSNIANSNSYDSIANIDSYCFLRGYTSWEPLSEEDKEAAIHRAMNYLEAKSWMGMASSETQSLAWPRTGVYYRGYLLGSDVIPKALKSALAEASYRESVNPSILLPDLERGGAIKRKKIDVLETEWFNGASNETQFTAIDSLLAGLCYSWDSIVVVRA